MLRRPFKVGIMGGLQRSVWPWGRAWEKGWGCTDNVDPPGEEGSRTSHCPQHNWNIHQQHTAPASRPGLLQRLQAGSGEQWRVSYHFTGSTRWNLEGGHPIRLASENRAAAHLPGCQEEVTEDFWGPLNETGCAHSPGAQSSLGKGRRGREESSLSS